MDADDSRLQFLHLQTKFASPRLRWLVHFLVDMISLLQIQAGVSSGNRLSETYEPTHRDRLRIRLPARGTLNRKSIPEGIFFRVDRP